MLKYIKWTSMFLAVSAFLWFGVSLAVYRIPSGEASLTFEGNVHYKFIELESDNRTSFESLVGNYRTRLDGAPILYLSGEEKARIWSPSPRDLEEKRYTLRPKLEAKPLLFGGFGVARIVDVARVKGEPHISK